ncbi:MAG TPA: restriction endonuclease [Symbiobacteriaceae bacterium]|jgi:hypothetical protein|nr:restriction endonuclease [Symbiobacteriaceae bacterium]
MELWIYAGIALLVAAALGLIFGGRSEQARRYSHMDLAEVRRLRRRDLEELLNDLFYRLGYKATVNTDGGIDILITAPDGTKTAVQTSHWRADYVGGEPVRTTADTAARAGCQQAIIISTVGYTDSAREASRSTGVELWGPEDIADLLEKARTAQTGARQRAVALVPIAHVAGLLVPRQIAQSRIDRSVSLSAPQQQGTQTLAPTPIVKPVRTAPPQVETPRCPKCGLPMLARIALDRPIWVCQRFPKCRGYAQR